MNYTTPLNVEKYLTIDIEAGFEAQVTKWITAMSQWADKYCNRILVLPAPTAVSVRLFSGDGGQTLHIDECTGITAVTDANDVAIADYKTFPLNAAYVQAIFTEGRYFTRGVGNYKVTAKWAQSVTDTVPEDIQHAITILVAGIVNNSRSGGDSVASEKVGMYSVTYKNQADRDDYKTAITILDTYKRIAI